MTQQFESEQNADARLTEILQAIQLLIAGNLNSETKADDMINLADYDSNIKEKAIINKHSLDLYVERAKKYHAFLPLFSIFATENESLNCKLK